MAYIGKQPTKAALTASDIEDGIITAAKIEDGAVVAAEIASNAVTTAKINADAVTGAKIADDAINSEHYTDGSIDTAHLADGQVTTAKLSTAVFTGATDIGAAIVDADLFLMDDGAGGTIRKTTASRLKTYAGGVAGITSSADANAITITDTELVQIKNANDTGGYLSISDGDSGATANSNATDLVIENNGGAGISILTFNNAAANIYFGDGQDDDAGRIVYDHGTGTLTANAMAFYTAGNEVARFDAAGKLRLLHGDFGATPSSSNKGFEFRANGSTGGTLDCAITGTSNHTIINFDNGNGGVGTIQMNGSATAYNTSSDYRLKENVNYDFDATSRLKQLKPARFNFKADADTTVDGFLAHEVSSIVPEAISGEKDAVNEDGTPDYQSIDQSKLVPLLVKTIQELEARIKALEDV